MGGGGGGGGSYWLQFLKWLILIPLHTECTSDTNVSIVVTTPGETVNATSTILMVCVAHGSPTPSIGWQLRDTTVTNCTSERVKLDLATYCIY